MQLRMVIATCTAIRKQERMIKNKPSIVPVIGERRLLYTGSCILFVTSVRKPLLLSCITKFSCTSFCAEVRTHAVKVARELIDKCDAEKRAMNADETGKYEAAMSDFDSLDAQIKQEQRVKSLEKEIELPLNPAKQEFKSDAEKAAIEQRAAFNKYLRSGSRMLNEAEHRALSAGVDTDGGYLVAPQAFIATLLKAVDDLVAIRGLATIIPLAKAESLGVPTMDTDVSDADWTPELSTGSLDDSLKFGKREMLPHESYGWTQKEVDDHKLT